MNQGMAFLKTAQACRHARRILRNKDSVYEYSQKHYSKKPLSFIRTMTVGSGFTPDLLDLYKLPLRHVNVLRGFSVTRSIYKAHAFIKLPPVGNYTLP